MKYNPLIREKQGDQLVVTENRTGSQAGIWAASVPQDDWPDLPGFRDQAMEVSQAPWGDRRTELIIIGQGLDQEEITDEHEECLLTDEEMSLTPERWSMFSDPLPEWCE